MRSQTLCVLAVLAAGACAPPPPDPQPQPNTTAAPAPAAEVDPERIRRIRPELPDGYEVADVGGYASSPVAFWGFGRGWTAEPPQCATLVDPAPDGAALGVSGSGAGGIIHVVVVTLPAGGQGPIGLDPVRLGECGRWTMSYGSSSADVSLVDAPVIEGAATLGTSSTIRNVVESDTETDSRADTFMAHLSRYVVFVTLVTDPGSVEPPLPPQYASDLLVRTVATLRG
ncbi:MAG: putative secreted protein [Mycobacterium sp.]|nr:putative secreted protein [Mycobacterium sp.]